MIIAQYSPTFTAGQLAAFLGIILFVFALILAGRKVFGQDPPLHKEYVTRNEHESLKKKMDEELGRERGARKQIHQDIAALQTGIEVVKSQNREQSERIGEIRNDQLAIRDRIDDFPKRTIELLRSSGALK